jgi:hypothetical protein
VSHHLDSPLARQDPRLNITDQFVFADGQSTVLVMDVNTSLAGATPGFHPEGRYEFKVHLDDSDRESLCYRLEFSSPAGAGGTPGPEDQSYVLSYLSGDVGDDAVGTVLAEGRTGQTTTTDAGLRVWAGRARDPFYLDLAELKAVIGAVQHGEPLELAPWRGQATSSFAGSTVYSIVLAVPLTDAELTPGRHVAVWSAAQLATDAGGWHQVSRAGLPMMWPIFRDDSTEEASSANETHPADDVEHYTESLSGLVASLAARTGSVADPAAYGRSVGGRLLPDLLRYEIGSPAGLTFASFNGRTLGDNAPEVMFSLATNSAVPTGLSPATTTDLRTATFPFVVPS